MARNKIKTDVLESVSKQEFIDHITEVIKDTVVTAVSYYMDGRVTKTDTFYLWHPANNTWTNFTTDTYAFSQSDMVKSLQRAKEINDIPASNQLAKDFQTAVLIKALWPGIFDRSTYLSVTNDKFIYASTSSALIDIHTHADSLKYIQHRPD